MVPLLLQVSVRLEQRSGAPRHRLVDHLPLEGDDGLAGVAAAPYASRRRRARSSSSGDGENTRFAHATWLGWMHTLPP